jgi:hypothetical protein
LPNNKVRADHYGSVHSSCLEKPPDTPLKIPG